MFVQVLVYWCCHALLASSCVNAEVMESRAPPLLPRQFTADVHVISHLVDPTQVYPPSTRHMRVSYDYDRRVARADMINGFESNKTYIRRYDQKREYMVKFGKYPKCERAYLGEEMPLPEIPHVQTYVGIEKVRDIVCEHWVHAYANVRVHIFIDVQSRVPVRLTEENLIGESPTLLLTYDLHDVQLGTHPDAMFEAQEVATHQKCTRNVGGF
ncbi:TPA: hypothetical protein N0F65_008065, partial [Lagenidium giganteum]